MTMLDLESLTTHRRGFLGRVAAGAAAVGLGGLFAPLRAAAEPLAARRDASASPDFEAWLDRKSTRLNSSHDQISYAVFCLKKKKPELTDHAELLAHEDV